MNRRQFLCKGSVASLALLAFLGFATRAFGKNPSPQFDVDSFFESHNPAVLKLAKDVFQQCVLNKIKPPEGTLKRRWLDSGTGEAFYGQWIWDTMFVVDLLAMVPGTVAPQATT